MDSLIEQHPASKYFKLIRNILFAAFTLFIAFKLLSYNFNMINYPYPLEYREGGMLLTNVALSQGINPYALKNQPLYTNTYGIAYNLAIYPILKIFGTSIFVQRLLSAVFLWACCALLFVVARRNKISILVSIASILLFYAHTLYPSTTTAHPGPHSFGILMYLCTLFIPYLCNYSRLSLILSILLGLIALYAKLYFVLGIPILALYLFLFVSKRKGLFYGLIFLAVLIPSIILMQKIFHAYFTNTFFTVMTAQQLYFQYALIQFAYFIKVNMYIFILLVLSAIVYITTHLKQKKNSIPVVEKRGTTINWLNFDTPLINHSADFINFCLITSSLIILLKFGQHHGSWMAYFFQLISPFFVIFIARALSMRFTWETLLMIGLSVNLYTLSTQELAVMKEPLTQKQWEFLRELIRTHENILNSPAVVPIMIEMNRIIVDTGQNESFRDGVMRHWIFKYFATKIPSASDQSAYYVDPLYLKKYLDYQEAIHKSIREKQYDLLLINRDHPIWISDQPLEPFYELKGEIYIEMPFARQHWILQAWVPKR